MIASVVPKALDERTPTPGSPEKSAVRSMFDRIAPRYDLLNRLLSAGTDVRWRRACVDFLGLPPASRVLDLCTGTADLLIEFLRRDPRNRGVGVDLSTEMVRLGRSKMPDRARGALAVGDAERLPLREGIADGAFVAFGIRNVGDPQAALEEVRRVLRPGGVFVVLEFSMPRGLLGALYRVYFRRLLPLVGGLVSGSRSAYAYLPASVARFPSPEAFGDLMERVGFREVKWQALTAGIAYLHRGVK